MSWGNVDFLSSVIHLFEKLYTNFPEYFVSGIIYIVHLEGVPFHPLVAGTYMYRSFNKFNLHFTN